MVPAAESGGSTTPPETASAPPAEGDSPNPGARRRRSIHHERIRGSRFQIGGLVPTAWRASPSRRLAHPQAPTAPS
jgi:hypothetical protein